MEITNDPDVEPDETFTVNLDTPSANATISDNEATGTITNGDPLTLVSLQLKIKQGSPANSVDADWGSGNSHCDSNCTNIMIPIQADVMLTANPDPAPPDYWYFDRFSNGVSSPSNPLTYVMDASKNIDVEFKKGGHTVTINKAGAGTGSVVASAGAPSGDGGGTTSSFPAVYAYPNGDTVTLTPTADPGFAFIGWAGSGSGSPVRTLDINDTNGDQTVTVTFDPIQISIDDPTVNEADGTATFTVSLSSQAGENVTVEYETADHTAVAPGDYGAIGTTLLTFLPGETSKQIEVTIHDDAVNEGDEDFYVNLNNQSPNATIAKNQGVGTIRNDDYEIASLSVMQAHPRKRGRSPLW